MPGVRGSGGPVPKPAAQRRRRNKPDVPVDTIPSTPVGGAPAADPSWHPIAREWFDALGQSGQSGLYQASDWAQARLIAAMMHSLCSAEKPSAQLLQSVLSGATELLTTEGARRRLRLELAAGEKVDEDEQASVTMLADYMSRAGG